MLLKTLFLYSLITSGSLWASTFNDAAYSFDSDKLQASQDSFHFLRSFVDYFYLVLKANRSDLPLIASLDSTSGWCVGDAHAENFGFIIKQNGNTVFTHNDMDDSGPAPIIYDVYRLMVSSRLYDSSIDVNKMMVVYIDGLNNSKEAVPGAIQDMLSKSQKNGMSPSKSKVINNKIVRTAESVELNADQIGSMNKVFVSLKDNLANNAKLIDAVQTSKVGGGSGGLKRFELLIDNGGQLLHLELKAEVKPSIYPVAAGEIPDTATRIATTLRMDHGTNPSAFYKVVNINGQDMLMRPRFSGNIGVSLDKTSLAENESIIYYESYVLGLIHSRSIKKTDDWIKSLQKIKSSDLEKDVNFMVNLFNTKYTSLTH